MTINFIPYILFLDIKYVNQMLTNNLCDRVDSLKFEDELSIEDFVGYLSSWSPYRKYRTMNPDKEDPLKIVYEKYEVFLLILLFFKFI